MLGAVVNGREMIMNRKKYFAAYGAGRRGRGAALLGQLFWLRPSSSVRLLEVDLSGDQGRVVTRIRWSAAVGRNAVDYIGLPLS